MTKEHTQEHTELIYDTLGKVIYYYDHELFIIKGKEHKKMSFQKFIREIDICPDKSAIWKRNTILRYAAKVGMLLCTA